jgi:hypothetical protein
MRVAMRAAVRAMRMAMRVVLHVPSRLPLHALAALLACWGLLACATPRAVLPPGQRATPVPHDPLLLVPARMPAVARVRLADLTASEMQPLALRALGELGLRAESSAQQPPLEQIDELIVAAELHAQDAALNLLVVARGDFTAWHAQHVASQWRWDARGAFRARRTVPGARELLVLDAQHVAWVDPVLVDAFFATLADPRKSLLHRDGVARRAQGTGFRAASVALFAALAPEHVTRLSQWPHLAVRALAPALGHLDAARVELHLAQETELLVRVYSGTEAFSAYALDAVRPHLDAFAQASPPALRAFWQGSTLQSDAGDLTLRWRGAAAQLLAALSDLLPWAA